MDKIIISQMIDSKIEKRKSNQGMHTIFILTEK